MEDLFNTDKKDLEQLFEDLTEEAIQDLCSSQVYYRGVEYFENDHVAGAEFDAGKTMLKAKVSGNRSYAIQVQLKNRTVSASCTCPHGAVCKHVVATLLYATNNEIATASASANSKQDVKKYLDSLPKEQLVDLLLKYAPKEFLTTIRNGHSGTANAQKIIDKAKRNLQQAFSDDRYLSDPNALEELLVKEIQKISGLEKKQPREAGNLAICIIKEVEEAMDNGDLYDHYSDYIFEPPEPFYTFLTDCIKEMDFTEKTKFINELEMLISNSSYTTFSPVYECLGKGFSEEDLPGLKTLLINEYENLSGAINESYYGRVSDMLSAEEKEKILTVLVKSDDHRALELAELLGATGKRKKSITMLKRLISQEYVEEDICFIYLDQLSAEGVDLHDAAMECIKRCPTAKLLEKIGKMLPSGTTVFEQIVEKKDPDELLNYLEKSNRIPDALALIKRNRNISDDRAFTFFKRNKNDLSRDAAKYFKATIKSHLEYTGDDHYRVVADALNHLMDIDEESGIGLIHEIRQNYKRRSKLMSMIPNVR